MKPAAEGQVAKLFCELQERAFTGIAEISTAERQTLLTFYTGDPVFVEESTLGDSLAQTLLERATISREQYSTVVERMTEELVDNEDLRFCEIALELGYLTSEQVFEAITRRVQDKITEAVGWQDCEITLEDTRGEYGGHERFRVSIGPLIYRGIRTHYDEKRVGACLGTSAREFVRLRDPVGSVAARFDLDDEETKVLEACDGLATTGVVVKRSDLAPLHARRLMCVLKLSSSVEFSRQAFVGAQVAGAPTETPRTAVERNAAASAPVYPTDDRWTDGAAFEVAERPAPSSQKRPAVRADPVADERQDQQRAARRAEVVATPRTPRQQEAPRAPQKAPPRKSAHKPLKRPTVALDRLSRELRKRDVKPPAGRKTTGTAAVQELLRRIPQKTEVREEPAVQESSGDPARDAWKKGRRFLLQQHLPRAREEFRRACEMEPEQGAYRLYYLWTEFREAGTPIDRESSHQELRKLAETYSCDPDHDGFANYVLGHLALLEKNERSAEKLFRKAADMDPNLKDAERHYRLLLNRRQKG